MSILISIGLFLLGLVVIVKGADWMTDGAAAIAKRYGISTMVIGMTIVAIGSSAPEFVVSALAAFEGNTDMAIGNVVGSNIFNILVIMGATAFVSPVVSSKGNIRYDLPFVILSSLVILFAAFDSIFTPDAVNEISRSEGLLMLCLFAIYISYTITIAKKSDNVQPASGATQPEAKAAEVKPLWKCVLLVVVGLAMLLFGGDWLVDGASGIAIALGVSQSVVALTIVSMGTSAPELASSIMAARKGDTDMALGNVVGSVIFNVFFVLGVAAVINPLALGNISLMDIITLLLSSVLLWAFCKTHSSLGRVEGLIMIIIQIIYYVLLIWQA
ncbi:MAG: calcium/sodium antiporter [Paludibacteraceae bacterium]|nr:calcium/sodium antiporter [Paludibacteraceae bacterium]